MKYNVTHSRKLIGRIAKSADDDTPWGRLNVSSVTTGSDGWNRQRINPIMDAIANHYGIESTDETIDKVSRWMDEETPVADQLSYPNPIDWEELFSQSPPVIVDFNEVMPWDEPIPQPPADSFKSKLERMRHEKVVIEREIKHESSALSEIPILRKEILDLAKNIGSELSEIKKQNDSNVNQTESNAVIDVSSIKGVVAQSIKDLYDSTTDQEKAELLKKANELPNLYPIDSTFIAPDWFDRLKVWINAGVHVAIGGSTGAGKTFPAKQACASLGLPAKTIAMNGGIDAETLVAIPHLKDGTSSYVDGFLTHAMRHGYCLILDEADSLRQEEALVLNDAIESRMITVPFTGEVVKASEGFVVIFTSNSLGDELGLYNREGFDASLLNRCRMVLANPLSVEQEVAILTLIKSPSGQSISDTDARLLAQWAKIARTAHFGNQGQDPVLKTNPSTRVLVNTVAEWLGFNPETNKTMPAYKDDPAFKSDIRKALKYTFASCLNDDERTCLKSLDLWAWE